MKVEELALKVAKEVYGEAIDDCDHELLLEYTTRFLAAYTAQQEPVKYLCKGARFKTYLTTDRGVVLEGLPRELAGIWVAMVEATNDCHLRHAAPVVPADMVLVPREPTEAMIRASWDCAGLTSPADGKRKYIAIAWHAMIAAWEKKS